MQIFDDQEQYFELKILGYEFPELTDFWDGNWLMVQGRVKNLDFEWDFLDPCLRVEEAWMLQRWLYNVSRKKVSAASSRLFKDGILLFMEPNLTFYLVRKYQNYSTIEISFCLEALPKNIEKDNDGIYPSVSLFLDLPNDQIKEASDELALELANFLPRGEKDSLSL
jgi:hypothetical protein